MNHKNKNISNVKSKTKDNISLVFLVNASKFIMIMIMIGVVAHNRNLVQNPIFINIILAKFFKNFV